MKECSKKKKETRIQNDINTSEETNSPVYVHITCRKTFTDKRNLNKDAGKNARTETRSQTEEFNLHEHCLFCNELCVEDPKHPSRKSWIEASTIKLKKTILDICTSRLKVNPDDKWTIEVKARTTNCIDIIAAKAWYHQICRVEFQTGKKGNRRVCCSMGKGRRENRIQMKGFFVACIWIENQSEVLSMKQFRDKMQESMEDMPAYSTNWLQKLL